MALQRLTTDGSSHEWSWGGDGAETNQCRSAQPERVPSEALFRARNSRMGGYAPLAGPIEWSREPASVAENMYDDSAFVRSSAMLPQVDTLPGTESEASSHYGNALRGLGQRGAGVRRHVIRTLVVVLPAA